MTSGAFLLDVNVLIALIDPAHTTHDSAHAWFAAEGHLAWASCPLTENGVVRILGSLRYPNKPETPGAVAELVSRLCALPGHVFWPDDISLRDSSRFDLTRLLHSTQVTDTYLLGLARAHGGRLASFDRKLVKDAVHGGANALLLI